VRKIDRQLIASTYLETGRINKTAANLGINEKTVRNALKELNVKTTPRRLRNRRYTVDDEFFDQINTPEKAYVLGFVWGDGNIVNRKSNRQLRFEIASRDRALLENIKNMMGSNHAILDRKRVRKGTETFASILSIPRKSVVDSLLRQGMMERKNDELQLPKIPTHLFSHFLLGFSDADGHIGIDSFGRAIWSVIGTPSLIKQIVVKLDMFDIKARLIKESGFSYDMCRAEITNRENILRLRSYLYDHCAYPTLARKKEMFFRVAYLKGGPKHG
jgi:hypothetical protein